ncbi:MAG: SufD family Fe-S cluster assembly protein [Euryarchaeota archaeon]|nr:SufD family Fe-S cluster assembly protein [Euryarchaeota archaeon]
MGTATSRKNVEVGKVIEVSMEDVIRKALEKVSSLGLEVQKGGSFLIDESVVFKALSSELRRYGILYLDIREALDSYRDLVEEYSRRIGVKIPEKPSGGVLFYVPEGVKLREPIYTCLAISKPGFMQKVANLYVIEDGGEAVTAKGCLAYVREGAHVGLTGVYIGKGARLVSVMLHNWTPKVTVTSYTKVLTLDNAELYEYYINLTPLHRIRYIVDILLKGVGAKARSDMVVIGRGSSDMMYKVNARLLGKGSSAELRSRVLGREKSKIVTKASITASAPETRGHIECHGLLLSQDAEISTVPTLHSSIPETMLTHEASIGRISKEALDYLMAKGFTEEEAISLIVRGFIELGIDKLPTRLRELIARAVDTIAKPGM